MGGQAEKLCMRLLSVKVAPPRKLASLLHMPYRQPARPAGRPGRGPASPVLWRVRLCDPGTGPSRRRSTRVGDVPDHVA
jgi:hypothetical protein